MILVGSLVPWLLSYKYVVLVPAVVVEGPMVTILAGFLVAQGYLAGSVVYIVVVVADVVGDCMYYALGRWGRWQFTGRVEELEHHFRERAGATLLIGKLTHGIGVAVLVAAGAAKVPLGKFIGFNFMAALPKSLVLLVLGYYFGAAYGQWERYLNYTALGMVGFSVIGLLVYFLFRHESVNRH